LFVKCGVVVHHRGKSKNDRQHNGQKEKGKGTINGPQNIHIKLKIE